MNEVEALPYDIDGLCVYKLQFKKDAMMQSLADGRPGADGSVQAERTLMEHAK